jgi:DNA-binding response OmpR family regulator
MHVVLLVEDNPGDAALVGGWLEDAAPPKFAVQHVTHLGEAERRASLQRYEAAILDLGLPDSVGLDTVRRFRARAPVCPIVVLTGSADERLVTRVVQCGADEVVEKDSAGPQVLASALDRAIARHHGAEESRARLLWDHILVLQRGLDVHPDGLVVHDDTGRVVFANRLARQMLGVTSGDVLPDPLRPCDTPWTGRASVTSADGARRDLHLLGHSIEDGGAPAPGRLLVMRTVEQGGRDDDGFGDIVPGFARERR